MKKFFLSQPLWVKIVNIAVIIIALVSATFTIFRWLNLFNFFANDLVLEIVSLVISAVAITFSLAFMLMRYTVSAKGITLRLFGTDILKNQVRIERILKFFIADEKLYVCYTDMTNEPRILMISVKKTAYKEFTDFVRKFNPTITVTDTEIIEEKDNNDD